MAVVQLVLCFVSSFTVLRYDWDASMSQTPMIITNHHWSPSPNTIDHQHQSLISGLICFSETLLIHHNHHNSPIVTSKPRIPVIDITSRSTDWFSCLQIRASASMLAHRLLSPSSLGGLCHGPGIGQNINITKNAWQCQKYHCTECLLKISSWIAQVYRKHRRPRRFHNWERGVKEVEAHTNDISRESNVLWDIVANHIKIFACYTVLNLSSSQTKLPKLIKDISDESCLAQMGHLTQPLRSEKELQEWTVSTTLWLCTSEKWNGEREFHGNHSTHSQRPKVWIVKIIDLHAVILHMSICCHHTEYNPKDCASKNTTPKLSSHIVALFTCIPLLMSINLNKFMLNS